ncbi:unnamed protein product [Porites evermanni]|uniref:DEX1 C-terminal domain-containing protein n=1 Tax=Porites evermanni TaxID=104178 RepID=A0ABN8QBW8_9CNID|nr:unnamed protein product [Porites evermanni]
MCATKATTRAYCIKVLLLALFLDALSSLMAHDCHRNSDPIWQADVGSSPVVSSPLVADLNGDNVNDVLVTSFNGQVSVVDGRSGQELPGWPVNLPGKLLFAAPLLYDYDNDGMHEVLLATADGMVIFLKSDGTFLDGETFLVPPLVMKKDWFVIDPQRIQDNDYLRSVSQPTKSARLLLYEEFIVKQDPLMDKKQVSNKSSGNGDYTIWSRYQPGVRPSGLSTDGLTIFVDPHILSTPFITDFNGDGSDEEVVIATNFYFEDKRQSFPSGQGLPSEELENYLGSALIVFNLQTKQLVFSSILEVTRQSSQYPGYVLSAASFVPGAGVVLGSSAGNIHLVKTLSTEPQSISTMDSIPGQVIASDVNQDGSFEILAIDNSGNIVCKDLSGKLVWEAQVSSSSAGGMRVADVDGDGFMEVVVATFDGFVWVLEGDTGKVLQGWPVKLPSEVRASVLLTKLIPGENTASDIIVPLIDGQIAIIRGSDRCTELISVGKPVLASAVSADLLIGRPGLELVLGTDDGTLICLANTPATATSSLPPDRNELFAWPAESLPCTGTTFYSGKVGVRFTSKSRLNTKISGRSFPLEFEIIDDQPKEVKGKKYNIKIIIGKQLAVFKKGYNVPGVFTEEMNAPSRPCRAVITIQLTTEHGQCFHSLLHASFNLDFKDDLAWLLIVPFVTTGSLLLVLHSWTQINPDLLPTVMTKIKR